GYYYFATRQYAVATIFCLILASVMQKGDKRVVSLIVISFIVATLVMFKDILFASYIEITNEQLQDDEDVRILAAEFFLFDYWPHWTALFLGNGLEHLNAEYGQKVRHIIEQYGYYRSDIG